jgi:hypothetical protein
MNTTPQAARHDPADETMRQRDPNVPVEDPIPDPEPSVPSLGEPDPGVFHHEPHTSKAKDKAL